MLNTLRAHREPILITLILGLVSVLLVTLALIPGSINTGLLGILLVAVAVEVTLLWIIGKQLGK